MILMASEPLLSLGHPKENLIVFYWNLRECFGNDLHFATFEGNKEKVVKLLKADPTLVESRFTYQVSANEEGSGQAIHLAASRGHLDVVKELLAHGASLAAFVTRNGRPFYDVLHAAIIAEGRGGEDHVIKFLLPKVQLGRTCDGKHPLHLAFVMGKPSLVCLIRSWMEKTDDKSSEPQWADSQSAVTAPLRLGIQGMKMTLRELILCADASVLSLRIFMEDSPRAVPLFLKRLDNLGMLRKVVDDAQITSFDVANLRRRSPDAALSILDASTVTPASHSDYPLPAEISFEPRDVPQMVWNLVNRGRKDAEVLTFLEEDNEWAYDFVRHRGPPWHDWLKYKGGETLEAKIQVCLIPDIMTPQVFSSLAAQETDMKVFENPTIANMIVHVFEHHAGKIPLVRSVMSLWALALLCLHSWSMRHLEPGDDLPQIASIAVRFLAAEGVVDVLWEFLEFCGWAAIGEPWQYFSMDNFLDWLGAFVPSYLWWDPTFRPVLVVTILLCWVRLLRVASCCEPIGRELQPFTRLLKGLGPVLYISGVAFGAWSHAFFSLQGGSLDLSVYNSFVTLITAGLPGEPNTDPLEAALLYLAVTVFTVVILNIFIGVIGEEYSRLKEESPLLFRQQRARMCLHYVLRKPHFRCNLCSPNLADLGVVLAVAVGIAIQVYSAHHGGYFLSEGEGFVYVILLAFMHAMSMQSYTLLPDGCSAKGRFLWFFCPASRSMEDTDLEEFTFDFDDSTLT